MKIFDIHVHFPRNWENPDEDPEPMVERLAEIATNVGIWKACMLTGGRFGPGYERGMQIIKRFPDLFIPVAMIDPEEIDGDAVQRLFDMGYRGLKLIGVARDYDCPDYFSAYGKAEELNMPILYHMGVIGGGLDYSRTHPRRDPKAAEAYRRMTAMTARMGPRNVSAGRMSPIHLDTIANRFHRSSRSSGSDNASRFVPPSLTCPPEITAGGGRMRSSACASVDLPLPDSPAMPRISPAPTWNDTRSMARTGPCSVM